MDEDSMVTELSPEDFMCIVDDELGELGCGAHCTVRTARHRSFGWVAVKCFAVTGGPGDRKRLEKKLKKELAALLRANNKNIVRVHGWVKWPRAMGLVMEYLPAGNLRQFTSSGSVVLPPKLILRLAVDIATALAFMHNLPGNRRIAHGDLKPENVLVTDDLHCKVGDFGSAELMAMTGFTTALERRPAKAGAMTMAYAAPERLKDLNAVAQKEHDTYSFGMLLFVLLTRTTLYRYHSHESSFLESIKRGERPNTEPIEEMKRNSNEEDAQIVEQLQSWIVGCWQQDPADRPCMVAVRDALEDLLNQHSCHEVFDDVTKVLKELSIKIPSPKKHRLLPLDCFSPIHGKFTREESVLNIYNLPSAEQVAIGCETVEFPASNPADVSANAENNSVGRNNTFSTGASPQLRPPLRERRTPTTAVSPQNGKGSEVQSDSPSNGTSPQPRSSQRRSCTSSTSPLVKERKARPASIGEKPKLKEVFEASDPAALPGAVKEIPQCLLKYTNCLKRLQFEEATKSKTKLISLIGKHVDATAEEARLFAVRLQHRDKYLESIAIFDAAASLSGSGETPKANLRKIRFSIEGMRDTNKAMIGDDAGMKLIVKDHVIPLMYEKMRRMEVTSEVPEELKCLQVAWALHSIERSEDRVDLWDDRKHTLDRARTRMNDVFGSDVTSYRLYGLLLNNLGHVYENASDFEKAASFFQQAIQAHTAATDHKSEEERRLRIVECENNLKLLQEHLVF